MKVVLSIVVVVVVVAVAVTANEDDGHNCFLIMMYVILMCVEHLCVDVARGALGFAWYNGLHCTSTWWYALYTLSCVRRSSTKICVSRIST